MKLIINNRLTGTHPVVVHAQGMANPKISVKLSSYFNELLNIFLNTNPPPSLSKRVTVITTTNYKTIGTLQKSLSHLQPKAEFRILGQDIEDFQLHQKIGLINSQLNSIKTEFVFFADSHDVIVTDLDAIVHRFSKCNYSMLLNSEPFFWPGPFEYNKPEINPKPMIMPEVFDSEIEDNLGKDKPNRYLNSGVWIAKTEFLRWLLPKYLDSPLNDVKFWHGGRVQTQDQIHYRHVLQSYPKIVRLDYESDIFQTLKEIEVISEETESKRFTLDSLEYTIRSVPKTFKNMLI